MKLIYTIVLAMVLQPGNLYAQDTTVTVDKKVIALTDIVIRSHFDYKTLIHQIINDTTFYKAFRNLRIMNYESYNYIQMQDKKGRSIATLNSRTKQTRKDGCRTMDVLQENTTGDFYNSIHAYNYLTAELYASLFFTKGKVCGENNIVKGATFNPANKQGTDKHKEQLKMLFFNPGKKIPDIPFIGNKLDLYDDNAASKYDYKLDERDYKGKFCYTFSIVPKTNLWFYQRSGIVVDEMTTYFDAITLEVLYRKYTLSYHAGLYSFDVDMEVEMTKVKDMLVPETLRYKGEWNVVFKKKERGAFTASLFNFSKE